MLADRFKLTGTIRARFLLALGLIGIVPLGVVGLGIALLDSRAITEQSARELTGLARGLAGQLDVYMSEVFSDTRAMAALPEIVSMDRARQGALLRELFHHYSKYWRLSTFDRSGRLLASSHPGALPSMTIRESFRTAAERGYQDWMVAPALSTGRSALFVHTPIRNAERRVVGVLGAVIDLENLSAVVGRVPVGGKGFAFVLDTNGRVLLHPDQVAVQERRDYSWIGVPSGGQVPGPGTVRYELVNEARIAGYAPLRKVGWSVVVERPEDELLVAANRSWRLALAGLIMSACLALLTAVLLARKLTRPLVALAEAAQALGSGSPSTPLPPMAPNSGELGTLVAAFEAMRRAVEVREGALERQAEIQKLLFDETKEKAKELAVAYKAAFTFNQSLNLETTLSVVLDEVLRVISADSASLRVLTEREGLMDFAVNKGFPEEYLAARARAQDIGKAARHVLATGEVVISDDLTEHPFFKGGILESLGYRSAIYLPINVRGTTLGILNLASREKGRFSEREKVILSSVSHQLGLALDNARLFKETQRNLERIQALQEIDRAVTSTLDLRTVLDLLLEKIDLFFPYPSATTVRLLNRETGVLEALACRGLNEKEWRTQDSRTVGGRAKKIFETKAPLTVRNIQTDPQTSKPAIFRKYGLVSHLGVPLIAKNETIGVLALYTKEEHDFTSEEIESLSNLASQAAIAIHNSELYQEMAKLAGDLARSNRVKDEFLSVMSHELRTPLNVIMGYTAMLKDSMLGEINQEQEKALEKILARSQEQLGMIGGILDATQLEANRVKVEHEEFGLKEFLEELRSDYRFRPPQELTIEWEYPPHLPVVKTDREKLKQILRNLINNAIKFTPKGSITISARITEPHALIEFKVADTGIGVAEEDLPVIFEKFRQLDSSETRLYGGVGIGLHLVKKFTELLGGKVEVESMPGKGSIFTVTIPCEVYPPAVRLQELGMESKDLNV
ncbi:MAG: GAF domain-containing protein [Deltaproteobacteria bacterium]|nr:GAF domain-containing protein [Deltaproteobacteria bacterium]